MPSLDYYTNLPNDRQLSVAERALTALLEEPEIAEAMLARNYDSKKVGEGRKLMEAAAGTVDVQTERAGDRSAATGTQAGRMREAQAMWRALSGTARAIFRDDAEALRALGLSGKHRGTYEARLARMRGFTVEARKPARLARFTEETRDVDETDFDALDAAIVAAGKQIVVQDGSEIRAEGSTDVREAAFSALEKWMLKMQGHARVVLRDRPDLLEMLGIPGR
ncbi:MAG TPA: hypothetical protein VGB53_11690 [Rubricoccaceae bacterium]|jgi:hypothetical protein